MFHFLHFHCLLSVTVMLNLVVLAPNAISSRLQKRQEVGELSANISNCAQTCITGAYTDNAVGCVYNDFSCICKSQSFLNSTLTCYATTCKDGDGEFASAWVVRSCASIGVNVTDFINTATLPNGTHMFSHARNSSTASRNSKKSECNLVAFTKTSASLLVGAGLAGLMISWI